MVVVVCPAGLSVKWQEEMRDRFGLEFRIVNTDAVRQLRRDRGVAANVFTSFPRLIVSIDSAYWRTRIAALLAHNGELQATSIIRVLGAHVRRRVCGVISLDVSDGHAAAAVAT